MDCEVCQNEIPSERLEALPETRRCVKCSNVKAKKVFPVYTHKTAPEMIVIDGGDDEAIRLAERANRREL